MDDTITYDYIHGTDVYIYQRKDMFRCNTDTSLLAAFMRIEEGERVLDIGTNNGALLAVAALKNPAYLYGIELQEAAAALACENMRHHHIDHVEIRCGDVCSMTMPAVDVIVCNPPYFKVDENSHTNTSEAMAIARHETYLPFSRLAQKMAEALQEKGRVYLVHRASRLVELLHELHQARLEVKTLQFVYDSAKEEAISVLIEAIKDGKANCHILSPQTITR